MIATAKYSVILGLTLAIGLPAIAAEKPAAVAVEVQPGKIVFRAGAEVVAEYVTAADIAKPYFWPLNVPLHSVDSVAITRAWPMVKTADGEPTDHVHQKSAWFCHGDVIPEGIELKRKVKGVEGVDFWSEGDGHGVIVCTERGTPNVSGAAGEIVTRNEWRTPEGLKILDETRSLQLHNLGAAWLLVVRSDLSASVCPITFGDTKEGALGVRVRRSVTEDNGRGLLTNAEGLNHERTVWGKTSAWCDYSGPVQNQSAGITIFASPENALPTCWHSRGYGLMAANPFGREKSGFPAMRGRKDLVHLAKGEHLKLCYGILLHRGDVKNGQVAACFEQFTKLPERLNRP